MQGRDGATSHMFRREIVCAQCIFRCCLEARIAVSRECTVKSFVVSRGWGRKLIGLPVGGRFALVEISARGGLGVPVGPRVDRINHLVECDNTLEWY